MTGHAAALTLDIDNLTVAFSSVPVLRGLTLHLASGSGSFLLGSNGSGKTTLLNVITGLVRAAAGQVRVGNRDLAPLSPSTRGATFLARSFQHPILANDLSVLRHVMLAMQPRQSIGALFAPSAKSQAETAEAALASMGLAGVAYTTPSRLTHAQRKLLDVTLAYVSRRPVLLLDEPAAGLDPAEKRFLASCLNDRPAAPTTLIVEHDPDFISLLGLPVHFLHAGAIACSGSLETVRDSMAQQYVHF